jgi:hypothetical protein
MIRDHDGQCWNCNGHRGQKPDDHTSLRSFFDAGKALGGYIVNLCSSFKCG